MSLPIRKPFLPSDLPRDPPGRALARAAFAIGKNAVEDRGSAAQVAEQSWPNDRAAIALTKAATSPASTTSSGWAGVLSPTATADYVGSLIGESAAARLIGAGLRISLDGLNSVLLPHRSTALPAVDTQWIAENGAFPIKQYTLAASTLGPMHKLATGVVLSREMAESAGGEEVFATLLREDVAASLDASLFSTTAASSTRPAGILNGISALTATTGGGATALQGDIAKLAAIASVVGSGNIAFICSPSYAVRMATYPTVLDLDNNQFQVWPSVAVADGTIIAIAPAAFASAFGAVPRITASKEAVVQMEDTSPAQLSTAGTPNVVSAPLRSVFQTDSIAVRVILDAAWTLRASGAVAWISGATW